MFFLERNNNDNDDDDDNDDKDTIAHQIGQLTF